MVRHNMTTFFEPGFVRRTFEFNVLVRLIVLGYWRLNEQQTKTNEVDGQGEILVD